MQCLSGIAGPCRRKALKGCRGFVQTAQGAEYTGMRNFRCQVARSKVGRDRKSLRAGAASAEQTQGWTQQVRGKEGSSFVKRFIASRCVTRQRVFLGKRRSLPA